MAVINQPCVSSKGCGGWVRIHWKISFTPYESKIHDDTFPLVCLANYVTQFYVVCKPLPSQQTRNCLTIPATFWCLICESKNRLDSCHFLLARAAILIHYLFSRCIKLSPLLNYFFLLPLPCYMYAFNFEIKSI